MKVQDIIDDLQAAEFSELAIGDSAFTETNTPRYLKLIQSALTELHVQFLLRQEELIIQPLEGLVDYPLHYDHADTSKVEAIKFIVDSVYQPFNWEPLQILGAYDELGNEIPINAPNHICGIYVSTPRSVMIPATITMRQISLVCRANHTVLTGLTDDINIPTTMRNALVWFIASRIWGSRKDDQASNKSVMYMQQYLSACELLRNTGTGVAVDVIEFNYKRDGWR